MSRLGIITGMIVESRILGAVTEQLPPASQPIVYCAGADAARAHDGAQTLIDRGAAALMSFGLAGGLAPALAPGDLLCATEVLDQAGGRWTAADDWRHRMAPLLGPDAEGPLLSGAEPVVSAERKAALHADTGALAVDMESAGVAAVAAAAGLPFLALRVIADPAGRQLPPSALRGLGPQGEQRPFAVLTALLARPGDIAGLLRLARDGARGMRRLRRVAALGEALFIGFRG